MTRPALTPQQKLSLLTLARQALRTWISENRTLRAEEMEQQALDPLLAAFGGAFVTLHQERALRGCVGNIHADQPLYQAVAEMAVAASSRDYRFDEVRPEEVDSLDIEISVLSPMELVQSEDEIMPGRDGIYLVHKRGRGLLLPQVASECGWTRIEFLEHTSRKAGLEPQAWSEAEIYRFTADVFGEKDFPEHE